MSWVDGDWLSFDTETTGVDIGTDRVVTAALLLAPAVGDPDPVFEWVVDPRVEIPPEAAGIHKYTTERARAEGSHPGVVMKLLRDALGWLWNPRTPLVVVNSPFDLSLLDAEFQRHLGEPLVLSGPVLDPMVCDRRLDRYRKGSRTLESLCAHYGVTLTAAHNSTADALAGVGVMRAVIRAFPEVGRRSLDELQHCQREWRREWAENFQVYLRGKKQQDGAGVEEVAAVVIDRGWPMQTSVGAR